MKYSLSNLFSVFALAAVAVFAALSWHNYYSAAWHDSIDWPKLEQHLYRIEIQHIDTRKWSVAESDVPKMVDWIKRRVKDFPTRAEIDSYGAVEPFYRIKLWLENGVTVFLPLYNIGNESDLEEFESLFLTPDEIGIPNETNVSQYLERDYPFRDKPKWASSSD